MKNKNLITILMITMLVMVLALGMLFTGCTPRNTDDYDKDGNLLISIRNLYFNDWTGGDAYLQQVEEKFKVKLSVSSYSWADWNEQVFGSVNANNVGDVFQFNLTSYNYSNSYEKWIKGDVIKALPDDLSPWPNIKALVEGASNIDALKKDGKLYCLPIVKNVKDTNDAYSPFTYVYRRDWAKQFGVYQENDIYTWEQFQALISAFYNEKSMPSGGNISAIADVEWGFPSIVNFFKMAPHCFVEKDGKYVCNYTTSEFMEGLNLAKSWVANNYYGYDQYNAKDGDVAKQYYAGRVGVFYENLSLANYSTLRKKMSENQQIGNDKAKLEDATAIMKVMAPDGKYCLEGSENWFSVTLFNADMSDEKMTRILNMLDWLLGEEGSALATYGIEGYDYTIENGEVVLSEAGWEKDMMGNYVDKFNGAKYLRYIASLGYDISANDPLVDKTALAILNDWYSFMDEQEAAGKLRILTEDGSVKWLSTSTKNYYASELLQDANAMITKYVYNKDDATAYNAHFSSSSWKETLDDINRSLGK